MIFFICIVVEEKNGTTINFKVQILAISYTNLSVDFVA